MTTQQDRRAELRMEFNTDSTAFLRRFVRAIRASNRHLRPSVMFVGEMIDFILAVEDPRQNDRTRDKVTPAERSDFLLWDPKGVVC